MIIFVGDKPSSKMKPGDRPFQDAACEKRLMEWITYLTVTTANSYKIVNSNTPQDMSYITDCYARFEKIKGCEVRCVALGNNASNRLKACGVPHFKLSHPSGRNKQLNDKTFIEQKLKECREWLNQKKKTITQK